MAANYDLAMIEEALRTVENVDEPRSCKCKGACMRKHGRGACPCKTWDELCNDACSCDYDFPYTSPSISSYYTANGSEVPNRKVFLPYVEACKHTTTNLFKDLISNGVNETDIVIAFKDFKPGVSLEDNFIESIKSSVLTVVPLCTTFLKRFGSLIESGCNQLYCLKLEDCDIPDRFKDHWNIIDYTDPTQKKYVIPNILKAIRDTTPMVCSEEADGSDKESVNANSFVSVNVEDGASNVHEPTGPQIATVLMESARRIETSEDFDPVTWSVKQFYHNPKRYLDEFSRTDGRLYHKIERVLIQQIVPDLRKDCSWNSLIALACCCSENVQLVVLELLLSWLTGPISWKAKNDDISKMEYALRHEINKPLQLYECMTDLTRLKVYGNVLRHIYANICNYTLAIEDIKNINCSITKHLKWLNDKKTSFMETKQVHNKPSVCIWQMIHSALEVIDDLLREIKLCQNKHKICKIALGGDESVIGLLDFFSLTSLVKRSYEVRTRVAKRLFNFVDTKNNVTIINDHVQHSIHIDYITDTYRYFSCHISQDNLVHESNSSCVFRGEILGQNVAIKIQHLLCLSELHNNNPEFDGAPRNIQHELKFLRKLSEGDKIIKLLAYQSQPNPMFYITKYMPHDNLSNFLRQRRNDYRRISLLCLNDLIGLILDMVDALKYCHDNNVIHRNILAESFLVAVNDKSFGCKLADFSLAQLVENTNRIDEEDGIYASIGFDESTEDELHFTGSEKEEITLLWSAPESLRYCQYSKSSDVWMLGCSIIEVLTHGCYPYRELQAMPVDDLVQLIVQGHISSQHPCIPDTLYWIIRGCFVYDPSERIMLDGLKSDLKVFREDCKLPGAHATGIHKPPPHTQCDRPKRGNPPGQIEGKLTLPGNLIYRVFTSVLTGKQTGDEPILLNEKFDLQYSLHYTYQDSPGNLLEVASRKTSMVCTLEDINIYLCQVADAVYYLHRNGIIHRDLRASYVQVSGKKEVLLFRLGRAVHQSLGFYDKDLWSCVTTKPVPEDSTIWSAPEIIENGCYSQASDVYSLATLIYQVYTAYDLGSSVAFSDTIPFPHLSNDKERRLEYLQRRETPDQPGSCSDPLYVVMKSCWHYERIRRPHMSEIVDFFSLPNSEKWSSSLLKHFAPVSDQFDDNIVEYAYVHRNPRHKRQRSLFKSPEKRQVLDKADISFFCRGAIKQRRSQYGPGAVYPSLATGTPAVLQSTERGVMKINPLCSPQSYLPVTVINELSRRMGIETGRRDALSFRDSASSQLTETTDLTGVRYVESPLPPGPAEIEFNTRIIPQMQHIFANRTPMYMNVRPGCTNDIH
ncbi:uncharacterized protein LOC144344205 [Saccoglossus kowalevskii]